MKGSLWSPQRTHCSKATSRRRGISAARNKQTNLIPNTHWHLFYIPKKNNNDVRYSSSLSATFVYCACAFHCVTASLLLPPIVISDFCLLSSFPTLLLPLPFLLPLSCQKEKKRRRKKIIKKKPSRSHSSLARSITSYPNHERGKNTICIPGHVCDAPGREGGRGEGKVGGRREGKTGRAGSLESQFEEWLKSLDIKSGVWGPLLTNPFAFFFLFFGSWVFFSRKEDGLTLGEGVKPGAGSPCYQP